MENHNWTGAGSSSIKGNPEAPYINYTLLPMASYANTIQETFGVYPLIRKAANETDLRSLFSVFP